MQAAAGLGDVMSAGGNENEMAHQFRLIFCVSGYVDVKGSVSVCWSMTYKHGNVESSSTNEAELQLLFLRVNVHC